MLCAAVNKRRSIASNFDFARVDMTCGVDSQGNGGSSLLLGSEGLRM